MIFTTHLSVLYLFNLPPNPLLSFLLSLSLFWYSRRELCFWENHFRTDKSMREKVRVFIYLNKFRKSKKLSTRVDHENIKLGPIWEEIRNTRECTMELQLSLIRSGGLHNVRSLIFYNSPVRWFLVFWSHCTPYMCWAQKWVWIHQEITCS